jgi:alanyl-tRNA synthetase
MPTAKLYWDDPFAVTFEAAEATESSFNGRPSIVLEKTLFYPEAGGQLADVGKINELTVEDVQIDEEGTIHHLIAGDGEVKISGAVRGSIDEARRRDFMAQHTAQHMLSRALVDVARGETVSARLGIGSCTIDIDRPGVHESDLAKAEDLVNAVILSDVAVRQHFPTPEELAKMPLRRPPKVSTGIRVIEVEGFDFSPCGGTHCTRTGQIGVVRIAAVEKYKGMTRVSFHAARRAIEDARKKEKVLAELARDFTCGVLDVPAAVAKLKGDLKARLDALSAARGELLELLAQEILRAHPPSTETMIVVKRPNDDVAMLRALAGRLTARPDVVAVCAAPDGDDLAIVVQRGSAATLDCGKWLKALTQEHGGKGGGRPERAEGRVPPKAI